MSDVFEGPGWWLASDGKWYPPHLHHDESYRRRHSIDSTPAGGDDGSPAQETAQDAAHPQATTMPEPSVTPVPGSVAEMLSGIGPEQRSDGSHPESAVDASEPVARTVDISRPTVDLDDELDGPVVNTTGRRPNSTPVSEILDRAERQRERAREASQQPAESEIESPRSDAVDSERESIDPVIRVADTDLAKEPDEDDSASPRERPSTSRARLEVRTINPAARAPTSRVTHIDTRPKTPQRTIGLRDESISTSTDLVPVPTLQIPDPDPVDLYDRMIAGALFFSGVAMIVGTFMPWENTLRVSSTGWELGDGLATVVAGVLGSAAAGPIFVGFRHIIPKTVAIVTGLVGSVVVGLSGLQVVTDSEVADTSVGVGFWIVLVGSICMLAAGLADRSALD